MAIVRIVSLDTLVTAILRGQAENHGRMPTRIIGCPTQVQRWKDDASSFARYPDTSGRLPTVMQVMGVYVMEGAADAPAELIWAKPVEET